MKIPRIFGVVVFLHVLVITIVLVQPGCRTKTAPSPAATTSSSGTDPITGMDPVLANEFNPVASPGGAPATWAPAPSAGGSTGRQAPTRPTVQMTPGGSPGTTVAGDPVAPSRSHTVARGESPWKISQLYGITVEELLEANQLGRSSTIQPGQVLAIPSRATPPPSASPVAAPAPAVTAAPSAVPAVTYTVRPGDTLSAIAARHGTTVASLRQTNRLTSDIIRSGQVLTIPGTGGGAPTPPPAPAGTPEMLGGATHTVVPGETPGGIARRYGVTVDALLRANNISDPRRLQVGQVLVIPGGTAAAAAPRAVAAPAGASAPSSPVATPARPISAEELEAQVRSATDADLLPVDDAPLTPVPPPSR